MLFPVAHQRSVISGICLALLVVVAGCSVPSHSANATSSSSTPTTVVTTTPSPAQVTTTLERIAFFNPSDGYGLFERRSADGLGCTWVIAKTTDGGASFAQLGTVDSWSCADNPDASFLAFDDHGDGFVYGPTLLVTHDGGLSWMSEAQPGTVTAVAALGYSVWMVEGVCPPGVPAPGSACPLRLFESSDGGRTWAPSPSEIPGATVSTGALTLEPAQGQSWLVRVNQLSAYVLSSPTPTQDGSPDAVPLWRTNDGGISWVSEQVPCGVDALSAMLDRAPDGSLVTICAGQPSAGSQPKSMAVCSDGGSSWSVKSQCSASQCTSSPLLSGYLGSVAATSSSAVFVTGVRAPLVITHDGGASWDADPSMGDVDGSPAQVFFFDATHGVVLGRQNTATSPVAIWHTADGGASWSMLTPTIH